MTCLFIKFSKLLALAWEVKGQGVPMGGQIFKMGILRFWLQIQNPCKKVWMQTTSLFLIFLWKYSKNWDRKSKLLSCLNFDFKTHFWPGSNKNIKKRKALCIHTFLQGFWICNQNCKIPILKIWPPIGTPWPLTSQARAKNFENLINKHIIPIYIPSQTIWPPRISPSNKNPGKKWV